MSKFIVFNSKKCLQMFFIVILCLIIFCFFYYKSGKNGNNISNKSQEEIIDYILNDVKEYEADVEVLVISNKTENTYKMKQKVNSEENTFEVYFPEEINGLKVSNFDNKLKISNSKIELNKIYENYQPLLNNMMFLNVFINDYKENDSVNYEENEKIVLQTDLKDNINTYIKSKELYIDKKTNKIEKLVIKDNTKKVRVCIKYNYIDIK